MKGIILAGGTGSRLGALSKVTNKHLLNVGDCPMIFYPLAQLLENGINDICVVSGTHHLGSVVSLLGSGERLNCTFTYKVQERAGGIAEALSLCHSFASDEDFAVFLGDNIFGDILNLSLLEHYNAKLFLKEVDDPQRFGVAEVDHMKKLIDIEEKPQNPKSSLAITGAYVYSSSVWAQIFKIDRSKRGELEISDLNKRMLDYNVMTEEVECWWSDAGTIQSLRKANIEINNNMSCRLTARIDKMINNI